MERFRSRSSLKSPSLQNCWLWLFIFSFFIILKCSKFILIKIFDISTILKVTFHLQLLQNIDYIPQIIWCIFKPIFCFSSPQVFLLLYMLNFGTEFVLSYSLTLSVCHSYFDKSALSVFTFLKCPSIRFYFNIRLFCHQCYCMTILILDADYIQFIVTWSLSYTQ